MRHAQNLVIMVAAGGLQEAIEMAAAFGVSPNAIRQLSVPTEQLPAKKVLITALCAARDAAEQV